MRAALDRLLALPCGLLPSRYWQSVDLPIANMATASAFITLFLGFGFGVTGYLDYLERNRNPKAINIVDIAELQNTGKLPTSTEVSAVPMAIAILAPITFAFFTPIGLAATYLLLSSFFRLMSAHVGEPFGDPLLTGIDAVGRRTFTTQRQRSQRVAREKLEGAEEPDRRYDGAWAGLEGVDYVIVSARRKPGWIKGTWVTTAHDGWFTLGEPFDRPTPNGLRTIYPLTLQTTTLDVLRKGVSYELPPLRSARLTNKPPAV